MSGPTPFHDRDGLIWLDGKMVPWREANIHILTHALHYGSGVFEGLRAYNGAIFKLSEHSQRLIDSAKALDFEIPYTVARDRPICRDVVEANKLSDCYIRPSLGAVVNRSAFPRRDENSSRSRSMGVGTPLPCRDST